MEMTVKLHGSQTLPSKTVATPWAILANPNINFKSIVRATRKRCEGDAGFVGRAPSGPASIHEQNALFTVPLLTPCVALCSSSTSPLSNCVQRSSMHLHNRGGASHSRGGARPSTADFTASASTVSPSPCGNGNDSSDQCSAKLASSPGARFSRGPIGSSSTKRSR